VNKRANQDRSMTALHSNLPGTFSVNAHTDTRTRFVDATSFECLFSIDLLPSLRTSTRTEII